MLTDYDGPASNTPELLPHLVGEEICAAFQDPEGKIVLWLSSGDAIVFSGSYYAQKGKDVEESIANQRATILEKIEELQKSLATLEVPQNA
jgi:hypothetical protein